MPRHRPRQRNGRRQALVSGGPCVIALASADVAAVATRLGRARWCVAWWWCGVLSGPAPASALVWAGGPGGEVLHDVVGGTGFVWCVGAAGLCLVQEVELVGQ